MFLFDIPDLTRNEKIQLYEFWATRYHNQSLAPITMSPTQKPEGGYGAWDATMFAKYVNQKSKSNPEIKKLLDPYKELPHNENHPVTKIFKEREASLTKQRESAVSADKERLDLQMKAEKSSYTAWVSHEMYKHSEGLLAIHVKQALDKKHEAFSALINYDKQHNHPLTDPNRNLEKDGPTVDERRDWMLNRTASNTQKYGTRERTFDATNDQEQAILGMMQERFLSPEQQAEFNRKAPARTESLIPQGLQNKIDQRKEIDRLTETQRVNGVAVGSDWMEKVPPSNIDKERLRSLSVLQESRQIAKVSLDQTQSATVGHAPAVRSAFQNNIPEHVTKLRKNLANSIEQRDRAQSAGQVAENMVASRIPTQTGSNPVQAPKSPVLGVREQAMVDAIQKRNSETEDFVIQHSQKSPLRLQAEKMAAPYAKKVEQGNADIFETKMANPDYVHKRLLSEKHNAQNNRTPQNVQKNVPTSTFMQRLSSQVNSFRQSIKQEFTDIRKASTKVTEDTIDKIRSILPANPYQAQRTAPPRTSNLLKWPNLPANPFEAQRNAHKNTQTNNPTQVRRQQNTQQNTQEQSRAAQTQKVAQNIQQQPVRKMIGPEDIKNFKVHRESQSQSHQH